MEQYIIIGIIIIVMIYIIYTNFAKSDEEGSNIKWDLMSEIRKLETRQKNNFANMTR